LSINPETRFHTGHSLPLNPLFPETLKWRPAIDAANGDTLLADCPQNFVPLDMLGFLLNLRMTCMKKKRFMDEQRDGVNASVTLKVRLFVVIGEVM
jgi:hypothetical protein